MPMPRLLVILLLAVCFAISFQAIVELEGNQPIPSLLAGLCDSGGRRPCP
ncbi:hypothetical protein KEU06_21040 [Pseudaminobacter sp. 19-2017]|uniref:Uncharacterized protein n=1 Tax=Pseudaminobacter soli (ex Zhang et al. 2022) TaxID=2831468 RepID=A0A942E9T9_9HYPH|nr:hypothetical protein [Pseudaminobacter soli]MBS3651102.1 hypothetical protein [Pseudaminobacter soli]